MFSYRSQLLHENGGLSTVKHSVSERIDEAQTRGGREVAPFKKTCKEALGIVALLNRRTVLVLQHRVNTHTISLVV